MHLEGNFRVIGGGVFMHSLVCSFVTAPLELTGRSEEEGSSRHEKKCVCVCVCIKK